MRGALELPRAYHKGLQSAEISQDERRLAQDEGEWERNAVEEWKKLNAEILLAWSIWAASFKAINSVRLLSIDHEDLRLAPDARDELLVIKLNNASRVQILKIALLE